jgi:hypothetical protein
LPGKYQILVLGIIGEKNESDRQKQYKEQDVYDKDYTGREESQAE